MVALTSGLFSKCLIASHHPTKIGSTVPKCQKLYIRLVVGTARISTSEKQNVEKLNIGGVRVAPPINVTGVQILDPVS